MAEGPCFSPLQPALTAQLVQSSASLSTAGERNFGDRRKFSDSPDFVPLAAFITEAIIRSRREPIAAEAQQQGNRENPCTLKQIGQANHRVVVVTGRARLDAVNNRHFESGYNERQNQRAANRQCRLPAQ